MNRRDKQTKLYKQANELFLAEKAKEEGITALPSGVLYRWLHRATPALGRESEFATPSSIVFVNYTGRLIDGSVFDTTEGQSLPACFVVRELIMGWQIALTRMRQGDRMEVYIPAEYGYGKRGVEGIPGYSTLVFELELVKLERR
ncbi:MAG: FKBP-type peptidyl-prolyl cis-trans isomerase [Bacteroidaceae bacterium]|nr:FKBP-type peptidyl-prolyl cis-trans isomerase [Bacteroidaceae bacterium]